MSGVPEPAGLPLVRVRRLPNKGITRRPVFEVEIHSTSDPTVTSSVTTDAYSLLRPIIGWDEAALVAVRASRLWRGGTGPWCTAISGGTESDEPTQLRTQKESLAGKVNLLAPVQPEPRVLIRRTTSEARAYLWEREARNRRYELQVGEGPSEVLDHGQLFNRIPGRVHTTDFHDSVTQADRLADAGDSSTWIIYGWAITFVPPQD